MPIKVSKKNATKTPAKKAGGTKDKKPATKAPKKDKPVKAKKSMSVMVPVSALSPASKALIKELDLLESTMTKAKAEFAKKLEKLVNANGSSSFEHPKKGPYCIMVRENAKTGEMTWWWRAKPAGHVSQAA